MREEGNNGNGNGNKRQALGLRPYQQEALAFMWQTPRVQCAMDMGTGKTAVSLALMQRSMEDAFETSRWLVVGPKLVVEDSWPAQLGKWDICQDMSWRVIKASDLGLVAGRVVQRRGCEVAVSPLQVRPGELVAKRLAGHVLYDRKATLARLQGMRERVHLVSWNNLELLVKAWGTQCPYDGLVLDESEFIGDSTGAWHQAAMFLAEKLKGADGSNRLRRLVQLSGLPTPNGRPGLHGQIRTLDGGERLGRTKAAFQERWLEPDKRNWQTGQVYSWKVRPGKAQEMDEAVKDVMFAIESPLDLPEWRINDVMVTLSPNETRFIAEMGGLGVSEVCLGQWVRAEDQAQRLAKVRQATTGAVYVEEAPGSEKQARGWVELGESKLNRLGELLEALARAERPVVIAYQWEHEWVRLKKRYPSLLNLADPGVLGKAKTGELRVVAGQCQAFSHGVDGLQHVYRDVIWTAATYSYGVWEQLRKRFHRDGVKGEVMVHRLLAAGTIEEQIAWEILPGKASDSDALLAALALLPEVSTG